MRTLLAALAALVPVHAVAAEVDSTQRSLALPLSSSALDALRGRDWARATAELQKLDPDKMVGGTKGDWAFLVAWSAVHGDDPAAALPLLPLMEGANTAPAAYRALVRGEALLGAGAALEALAELDTIPTSSVVWPRAALQRANALKELGRTQDARAIYEAMVARPDPAEGSAEALWALAQANGLSSPASKGLLRRIWARYPTHALAAEAQTHLSGAPPATWQEVAYRAEAMMNAGQLDAALAAAAPHAAKASDRSEDGCRLAFTRGRSLYKKNKLTDAVAAFGAIGQQCKDATGDYGPRGLYLLGTAEDRRKRPQAAADAYQQLADLYPTHSMADDALTRGGIALQEAGRLAEARVWWEKGLANYPDGDTVPEATWRLAFSWYLDGNTNRAVEVASALAALSRAGDATHVQAGRYWAARWLAWPDVSHPTRLTSDSTARAAAVDQLVALCRDEPWSYYAILGYARLLELAPERAAAVAQRPAGHPTGDLTAPWTVRDELLDGGLGVGAALMRLGLVHEARAEWAPHLEAMTPDEVAWTVELRGLTGDWLQAHDDMREWVVSHPLGSLGPNEANVVRVAYPDRYWAEVQASVLDSYRYEPRLFHGLVREESNFNRRIVSHAGARGLSQLMPATATQTAGWLSMTVTMDQLDDPATNLKIGAKYLDAMHKQLSDSPYLSLAAYNGGAGNVNKWIGEYGNLPTDEFVERIPFRETRGYVKRVMGTWQTYRHRFDVDSPVFQDLSRYNHQAKP